MDIEQAREFLNEHHHAVLVTRRKNGSVQTSPVLVGVDDEGRVIISSRETAYKVRHLRADPKVALCVFADTFFGHWIQIDGTADVLSLPDAMEPLVDYYRRVAGHHENWDDYRRAMEEDQRVLVRVTIEHVGPTRHG